MCYLLLVFVPVLLLVLSVLRPHVVRRQQLRVRVRLQERTQPLQRSMQSNLDRSRTIMLMNDLRYLIFLISSSS